MIVWTRQLNANRAYTRWCEQYRLRDGGAGPRGVRSGLKSLGALPDPDAVDALIGNRSWTYTFCDNCGVQVPGVVEMGQTDDAYAPPCYCEGCLAEALELLRRERRRPPE